MIDAEKEELQALAKALLTTCERLISPSVEALCEAILMEHNWGYSPWGDDCWYKPGIEDIRALRAYENQYFTQLYLSK